MEPNLSALAQIPRLSWDARPAEWYFDLLTDRVSSAIPSLAVIPVHPWRDIVPHLKRLYGDLDSPRHALNLDPLDWRHLHEPQITKTLSSYLDPQTGADGVSRCVAFLQTLFDLSGVAWGDPQALMPAGLRVATEERIAWRKKPRRLDLFLEITQDGVKKAVVMEFKLEHRATKRQLSDIAKWANKHYEDCLLFFVVPNPDTHTGVQNEHPDWQTLSWTTLLRRLELNMQHSPPESDTPSYRLFRRTMFQRVTGV